MKRGSLLISILGGAAIGSLTVLPICLKERSRAGTAGTIDRRSFDAGSVAGAVVVLEYEQKGTLEQIRHSGRLTEIAWQEFQDELRTNPGVRPPELR